MKDDAERARNAAIAVQLSNAVIYNSDGAFRALAFKNRHLIVAALNAFAQQPTDDALRVALHANDVDPPYGPIIAAFRAGMLDVAPIPGEE